jgi:hypothetical protein
MRQSSAQRRRLMSGVNRACENDAVAIGVRAGEIYR